MQTLLLHDKDLLLSPHSTCIYVCIHSSIRNELNTCMYIHNYYIYLYIYIEVGLYILCVEAYFYAHLLSI